MKKIISFILFLTIILSGCSEKKPADVSTEVSSDAKDKFGGIIKMGSVPIDTLNPLMTEHASISDFLSLVYEGLFETMPDQSVAPVIASGYKASADNTVYTIKVKDNIKFHNGKKLTAEDVVATIDYIFLYGGKYSYLRDYIMVYSASSDRSVDITLNNPVSDFVNLLDFPILPKGLGIESFMLPNADFRPVGTGMYKFGSYDSQKNIYLKANTKRHSSLPTPYIETIDVEILTDEETIIYAFDAGVIDVLTTSWIDGGEMNLSAPLYNAYSTVGNKFTFVGINTRAALFDTAQERRDLLGKINSFALCEDIMLGHAEVAKSPVREGVYYNESVGQTDEENIADDESSDDKKSDSHKDDKESTPPSKQPAAKKSGEDEPDEEVNRLVILYNSDSKTKERLAISLMHQLETAGYACTLTGDPFSVYLEKVANCHYDLYIGEVNPDNCVDIGFMFGSSRNIQNICSYTSEELDTLISNIRRMSVKEDKTVAWENFEKYYNENAFQIPLYFTKKEIYVNKRISGKLTPNISSLFSGFESLYIE